ncbi:histidine phosphatase family protein [Reichenbachiella agarivorans]|uniref:Histidine phosphatase family protein n=1 Tax=Reichenbachiella agarivorans TaxID=2979464 RepID=A0ABY6CM76_9BACT|nr:histidine phosphatase family protein [Reichenbachiella agarivorans]UXP31607.1 histidine phosphatase family protein [Reichenbachiella agarivorans]
MKSKNIYLIRHGQTDFNKQKRVQGRGIDSDLNLLGRLQAAAFFEVYKDVKFDKIYTSSLKRTVQSVQGFIDQGIPYESLSGFDEISWGLHEGLPYDEARHARYLEGIDEWGKGNLNHRVGEGDTPIEVRDRQIQAMDYVLSQENEHNILIATHGRAMRFQLCWMMGMPLSDSELFEHANLCLYQLRYDENKYEIIKRCDISHLAHIDSEFEV